MHGAKGPRDDIALNSTTRGQPEIQERTYKLVTGRPLAGPTSHHMHVLKQAWKPIRSSLHDGVVIPSPSKVGFKDQIRIIEGLITPQSLLTQRVHVGIWDILGP